MEGLSWLQAWWPQVLGIGLLVVVATKLKEQVHELRKDVDDINRRDMYTETVKLRAISDVHSKQISELWIHVNKLAEKK